MVWFDVYISIYLLSQQFNVLLVQFQMVLLQIFEQIVCAQDLSYFDQLISVALPHKERFLLEQHRGEHGSS